jgi:MerR family transcriptional regulator, light-induced transcriptional regulator
VTLDLSIKRVGVVVTQFNFDQSEASPDQPWASGSQDSKSQHEFGASPRLVGGTTFANKAPLDKLQVKLLTQAAIQGMEQTRKILTKWRRQGQCLADIYLYGITESARQIGELWSSDEIDFVNGTIAFSRLHRVMHEFSPEFLSEGKSASNGLSLLLMTEPASQHGLGAFMLSEFFRHAGWRVMLVTPQDIADFKRVFLSDWFDAVVLSISTDRQIYKMSKAVSELRQATINPRLKIFIGGPMANVSPDRLNWAGTTLLFTDATQTVERVTRAVDASAYPHTETLLTQQSHTNDLAFPQASKM